MISFQDFLKLDIRIGKIVEVKDHEKARNPMYILKVDFGSLGIKQAVAGIKPWYQKEELLEKKFPFVVNLQPKKIAGEASECMILAAVKHIGDKEEDVVVLQPEKDIEIGSKVS